MPIFSYRGKSETGEVLQGTIDAISLQAARASLTSMNMSVEELYETPKDEQSGDKPVWTFTDELQPLHMEPEAKEVEPSISETADEAAEYFPLFETFRLYAGWLLAWYGLAYALGSYQSTRNLPFRIPFAEALFISPLVLSFTIAAFLFLLCTTVYKLKPSKRNAILLSVLGIAVFGLYIRNV